jgi:hypothetical protein
MTPEKHQIEVWVRAFTYLLPQKRDFVIAQSLIPIGDNYFEIVSSSPKNGKPNVV